MGAFEYPQHMFWFRNKKIIFKHAFLSGGLAKDYSQILKMQMFGNSKSYLRNTQVPALLLLIPSLS